MHHKSDGRPGFVQVKSGDKRLNALDFALKSSEGEVFLHAPAGVENAANLTGITILDLNEIIHWSGKSLWVIGPSIRARLALLSDQCSPR
jgi:hypothetical protein